MTWNGGGSHAFWSVGHQPDEEGAQRGHPNRKPVVLMRELIRLFTNADDVVFDGYAGSGTTGVAALAEGRRVILYGFHRAVYDIWRESFRDPANGPPIPVRMITGSETPTQKDDAVRDFCREGGARVLIASRRSGAGIDGLQHVCSTVVFGELDWSPKVHDQCVMRVDRDGQTEPVQAFFCASEIGADPIMVEVNGAKRNNSEPVIDPDDARARREEAAGDDTTLDEIPSDITQRVARSIVDGSYLRPRGEP